MAESPSVKSELFESAPPAKALATMVVPTIASQLVILIYNLADTWFIGRTNNPYMIGAASLAATVYLALAAAANIFGVGGGSLMARLTGEKRLDEARSAASYSITAAALLGLAFSLLTLAFCNPMLRLLGASSNTLEYGRQYLMMTVVLGGVPAILSMTMPQLLRNAGYSKEAGIGVGLGNVMNIILDPLFMFVILPEGREVLGAAIATLLSNIISLCYFILMYRRVREESVLELPKRLEKIGKRNAASLYSVGIPSAVSIFLFDLVTIVINRLTASYGDIPLAAMGIVLRLERIPVNIGLGICLGMVPLVAYNYGAGNFRRMQSFAVMARNTILIFSLACFLVFRIFAESLVGAFIADENTVSMGGLFLSGRCPALPFMMTGYFVVNYMNAINRGKISFLLAVLRHLVFIIPIMLIMNHILGLTGLIWSQLAADVLSAAVSYYIYLKAVDSQDMRISVHPES